MTRRNCELRRMFKNPNIQHNYYYKMDSSQDQGSFPMNDRTFCFSLLKPIKNLSLKNNEIKLNN